ncbi:MAG: hypothetical protein ISS78_03810 [Phycisphaerae bacterium]|nr:hypothetical protein [Phycisphaerae bacterium]
MRKMQGEDDVHRIRKFNGVNAIQGYRVLDIRSPLEIDYDGEDQDI